MKAGVIALVLAGLAVLSYFIGRSIFLKGEKERSRDEILAAARAAKAEKALEKSLESADINPLNPPENG